MRIGQQNTITRLWAPKGERPRAVRQQQFESAYVFGAVCAQLDKAVALVLPEVGIEGMKLQMQQIAAETPQGYVSVVLCDRAAWHTSKKILEYDNVIILHLPPVSPELNPVEQLWRQLRHMFFANRVFKDYEAILEACCTAWRAFTGVPNAIKQLCSRGWQTLNPNCELSSV